jgi:hypothetical protein
VTRYKLIYPHLTAHSLVRVDQILLVKMSVRKTPPVSGRASFGTFQKEAKWLLKQGTQDVPIDRELRCLTRRRQNRRFLVQSPVGTRAVEKAACDRLAFMAERTRRYRVTGSSIPISSIRKIAFLPMQIGMDPGALTICLVNLNEAVSLIPIPTSVPPEGQQRTAPLLRRLCLMKSCFKRVDAHDPASW